MTSVKNSFQIFDTQFSHAISAGSPYNDISIPFDWKRKEIIIDERPIFFTESCYEMSKNISAPNKILWVLESPFMVGDSIVEDLLQNYTDFKTILTHDDRLLHLPNVINFPVGGCWVREQDCNVYEKNKNSVSMVTSTKVFTAGQVLRHRISTHKAITNFGPQFRPLDYKLDAMKDFQFHVCIENVSNNSYFTEKIVDCFATGTIPIYWGCKNISNYFNTKGIIEVDDYDELVHVLDNYEKFEIDQNAIKENFEISKEYWLPETRILSIFG
jgi:hypothetical protein